MLGLHDHYASEKLRGQFDHGSGFDRSRVVHLPAPVASGPPPSHIVLVIRLPVRPPSAERGSTYHPPAVDDNSYELTF